MKTINCVAALLIVCSVITLFGCSNTGNGFQEDWKQNTQKIANSTND